MRTLIPYCADCRGIRVYRIIRSASVIFHPDPSADPDLPGIPGRAGPFLIIGIVAMFLYQIFENIGMFIGLMPLTGITRLHQLRGHPCDQYGEPRGRHERQAPWPGSGGRYAGSACLSPGGF